MMTALERQAFDFLGYQWTPIMVNFLHIIMVLLCLFGTIQYRPRYIALYLLWTLPWVAWNVFVSCLYLDLGGLSKESDLLSLGVSSQRSWWKDNGPGCDDRDLHATRWQSLESPKLISALGCWLEYQYIRVPTLYHTTPNLYYKKRLASGLKMTDRQGGQKRNDRVKYLFWKSEIISPVTETEDIPTLLKT
ncbi:hypothetical protein J4Q44_G00258730 [Coregonus suidteri]|uniref:Sodium/potassium-transporting ATPase subunit beta-1-interacting protein n=1 Tax=Coregonus suidteri TaxID=861788 RepID=A0AAN8L7M9_9TELE